MDATFGLRFLNVDEDEEEHQIFLKERPTDNDGLDRNGSLWLEGMKESGLCRVPIRQEKREWIYRYFERVNLSEGQVDGGG